MKTVLLSVLSIYLHHCAVQLFNMFVVVFYVSVHLLDELSLMGQL